MGNFQVSPRSVGFEPAYPGLRSMACGNCQYSVISGRAKSYDVLRYGCVVRGREG